MYGFFKQQPAELTLLLFVPIKRPNIIHKTCRNICFGYNKDVYLRHKQKN